ncbi:MAG: DUF4391 domain-containing protein [Clostridia bacterium]
MSFPKATEVNKVMPKEAFYRNLDLNSAIKDSFVMDIKKIVWQNKLSADTLHIDKGETISEILVLNIELKKWDFNYKILEVISKNNTHNVLYILTFENKTQIALYHKKLYKTRWFENEPEISIKGLNMDLVWENIVRSLDIGEWSEELTLDENLEQIERKAKLQKEIEKLEKQARAEKQPKKKFELVQQVNKLKKDLESKE